MHEFALLVVWRWAQLQAGLQLCSLNPFLRLDAPPSLDLNLQAASLASPSANGPCEEGGTPLPAWRARHAGSALSARRRRLCLHPMPRGATCMHMPVHLPCPTDQAQVTGSRQLCVGVGAGQGMQQALSSCT